MIVKAKPLKVRSFAHYGQVLMGSGKKQERIPFAAKVKNDRGDAKPDITYVRITSVDLPIRLDVLERHSYSHQLFVPLNGARHLVIVCPSNNGGEPILSKLQAFTAEGFQAVNCNAGTWHAPRTSIGGPGEFIMMRWDNGTSEDEEFRTLKEMIEIIL